MDKKNILVGLLSGIAGSLIGGIIVFFITSYFLSDFFISGVTTSELVRLQSSVHTLKSLRNKDIAKAIDAQNLELRTNLVSVAGMYDSADPKTKEQIVKTIRETKAYLDKYPLTPINDQEKELLKNALDISRLTKH